jgi:heme/copper-type cytochrome/quinol oxidase subunit 1
MSGFYYDEVLAKIQFWSMFIGVNITFFPQRFLGLAGMPRRIPDFPDAYSQWNWISSLGSMISAVSGLLVIYIIFDSFKKKKKAENHYWFTPDFFSNYDKKNIQTQTLEWINESPAVERTQTQS